jgi:hypothetical protein
MMLRLAPNSLPARVINRRAPSGGSASESDMVSKVVRVARSGGLGPWRGKLGLDGAGWTRAEQAKLVRESLRKRDGLFRGPPRGSIKQPAHHASCPPVLLSSSPLLLYSRYTSTRSKMADIKKGTSHYAEPHENSY